jgi:drug/metabolite transporter, DME family
MRRSPVSGPMLVLGAATLWGTTGTAQALGPDGITPVTVAAIRMAGGATLLAYAALRGITTPLRNLRRLPLIAAVASMAASQPLFFTGVERTGVAIGTIVTIGCGPILAGGLAWAVRGERPGPRWGRATLLAVGGAALLVSGGEGAGVDAAGVGYALGAAAAWAVYLVAAKSLFARHPPVFVTAVVFTGAAAVLAPWFVVADTSWLATGRGVAIALWLTVVATAASYVLFATGLEATPVATAATLTLAEPLTAGVLGLAVLAEPLRWSTIVGIGLVCVGLLVLSRGAAPGRTVGGRRVRRLGTKDPPDGP